MSEEIPATRADQLPGADRFSAGVDLRLLEDLWVGAMAALAGGRAACAFYEDAELEIEHKGVNDPVTAADHAANAAILRVLLDARPADPILSEESTPPDRTWPTWTR